jgi:hypothetical protein
MPDSGRLFSFHKYEEALARAEKEAAGRGDDYFRMNAALTVVRSLLVLGRFEEAQTHTDELTSQRHFGARMGSRFTYAGLAYWFSNQTKQALRLWETGLNAGYQSQEGMEIPWVLLYASARRPSQIPRSRAVEIVQTKGDRLPEGSGEFTIKQFALRLWDKSLTLERLAVINECRFKEKLMKQDQSRIEFFAAIHALEEDDEEGFYDRMVTCASLTNYETIDVQLVIAECEINQGPAKWKKLLADRVASAIGPNVGKRTRGRAADSRPGARRKA